MEGNIQGNNSNNILVEFDYNNIIVVDPNKTIDAFGKIQERLVDNENLVKFINLEAELLPRTKLAVGGTSNDRIRTVSIAKINFLKPSKQTYFGTGYYDELTGENSTKFKGVNQMQQRVVQPKNGDKPYIINEPSNLQDIVDNGLLGITSIDIQLNTSFVPSVTIYLEDVQGKALFQLGNNSPYSAFFNLPYPIFYLTIKGYYGQAVRYQLNLEKFNCSFNSNTRGDYTVKLDFKGYKFNILNEISLGHLLAVPHMYASRFDVTTTPVQSQQNKKSALSNDQNNIVQNQDLANSNSQAVTQVVVKKGYQKILEVYSEYKAKGLIPMDFPELTLLQLMNKLENFEKLITDSFPKAEVEPLTNIRSFKGFLKNYFDAVRVGDNAWFSKYLNPKPFILLNSNQRVYVFKSELDLSAENQAIDQLKKIIDEYTKVLINNKTVGAKGPSPIPVPIKYDTIVYDQLTADKIDWKATITQQLGITNPNQLQILSFITSNKELFYVNIEIDDNKKRWDPISLQSFIFEGDGRFDRQISQIEAQANKKLSEYEASISNKLLRKIEDTATGIGFKPTVRNLIAVIMASSEAFIRLLDEVHTNAWNVKYDPVRKKAILDNPSSALGPDTVDKLPTSPNAVQNDSNYANSQIPVYPWPQFFVETPEDKKGRFQLTYIADPTIIDQTQGYLYDKWPEVEFVEEYLTGITQKFDPPVAPPPLENDRDTETLNINAIEFPNLGLAYANKEEVKFFYEIWERQFVTSRYSNLIRANQSQINDLIRLNVETEVNNIVKALGVSSPYITFKLKNYNLNSNDYVSFLQNISNSGTGRSYQDFIRDFFVTPYLRNLTRNSFGLLNILDIGKIPQSQTKSEALQILLTNASNQPLLIDTLPFTSPNWNLTNLSKGDSADGTAVYNTNKTLKIFEPRKIISNFTDVYDFKTNRPVTSFSYLASKNPYTETKSLVNDNVGFFNFYTNRQPLDLIPTEGYCFFNSPSNQNLFKKTTSMLNTPYFVNSILNGVSNNRGNDPYPYVQSAFLFLNSLPLATLREKYKTLTDTPQEDLDYIASCFKKFGAIHKLPYAWILKLGSNWHRYKKYKETGVDILTSCWNNFDYIKNYSPISGSTTQTYSFKYLQQNIEITLQNENTTDVNINVGFYPKLISDFNYFYTGYDLYKDYTNEEIQNSINDGMKVFSFPDSAINGTQENKNLRLQTWSVLIPRLEINSDKSCDTKNNTVGTDYYITPSFGSQVNQTKFECFNSSQSTIVPITSNTSVYNGSVRSLWVSPNYGYFDNDQILFPSYDSYLKNIDPKSSDQPPFQLLNENNYNKIEEIFSVFEKKILDLFEDQFLKFCRPDTNIDSGEKPAQFLQSNVNLDANYRNFQSLFTSLMTVPSNFENIEDIEYFQNTIDTQYGIFINGIKAFMNYDVLFKYGNPSNYDRRIWDSYLSHQSTDFVTDPIRFQPYVPNTLPSLNGGITLQQSKIKNPQAWRDLELEVGFSTIPKVSYSDNGSYITDFFIQNNIEFSSQNVQLLAPLIKMWATEKFNNPSTSSSVFQNKISEYLKKETTLQNYFLDQVLSGVRNLLPNQQQLVREIKSAIQSQQGKVNIYEMFKALNDKWIAGDNFTNKTLFEDILFLDRASRNIGDTIILDIFDIKNMFSKEGMNMKMSVYTYISDILIKNNFTVMNLPSYVNFYNVQEVDGTSIPQPEGSLEFANNMWGTFLNVDYRNSSQKMVCFYVGKPSAYLELPKGNFRFRDDSFDLRRASDNPLIENQKDKKDWAVSNKCVGFNVDFGVRNQNIFYSFNVDQSPGVATSESIDTFLNMVNQATGRNTATQNVSLYNLYTQRSYKCTVSSLGNALLQPTMYFNLRHVPMFNGPYMITSVAHKISTAEFTTQFTGVRQGIFDLPTIDNFLQSINQNLLTRLEELLKIEKDQTIVSATTENNKASELVQTSNNVKDASNSCVNNVDRQAYPDYVVTEVIERRITPLEFVDAINKNVPNDPFLKLFIYTISYIQSFVATNNNQDGEFVGYNNNFANITLDYDLRPASNEFFSKTFCCIRVKATSSVTKSLPFVSFSSLEKFIQFMASKLENNVDRILEPSMGLAKYYACYWPKENLSQNFFNSSNEFETLRKTITDGINSAIKAKLVTFDIGDEAKKTTNTNPESIPNPNVTPSPSPVPPLPGEVCPPPVLNSFAPLIGNTGTIIQLNGSGFENVNRVEILGTTVEMKDITIFNDSTMRVTIPQIVPPLLQVGDIVLYSPFGKNVSRTPQKFTYDPKLPANNAASPGSYQNNANSAIAANNNNLNPQSTGPLTMIGTTVMANPNKTQSLTVKINPQLNNWVISQLVVMNYSVYELSEVNGKIERSLVDNGSKEVQGYVYNNQFNITLNDIIENNWILYPKNEGKTQIDISFICRAFANEGKSVEQQFPFKIYYTQQNQQTVPTSNIPVGQTKPTYPPKNLSIVVTSLNSDVIVGNGPSYYNIEKPGGGYVVLQFVLPQNEQVTPSWIVNQKIYFSGVYSPVDAIFITPDSNSNYTNKVSVNNLGVMKLQIEYYSYGFTSPPNGEILKQTVFSPDFVL